MPKVLRIAVQAPLRSLFDYLPPAGVDPAALRPGVRVQVPFGPRRRIGVLLEIADASELDPARLKPVLAVLDPEPLLSADDLALLAWASRYYHYPIGEALALAFAPLLREGQSAAPETVRVLCPAGPGGAGAEALVKRSPRQAELLRLLREHPAGLPPAILAGLDGGKHAATALVGKGLALWREQAAQVAAAGTGTVHSPAPPLALNPGQAAAVARVLEALGGFRAFLLDGVTGSGKTEVYLRLAGEVLARGGQVMVLVPEISLTPQLEARFRARFPDPLAVYHSGLAAGERRRAWLAMQRGEAAILLGTRSAVFMPMRAPGLIVLDEEHDASFKQHDGFRFSARDVAVMRAHLLKIPVVLGSATPSLESLHNVRQGRYQRLHLPERAGGAAPPLFRLLDIRGQRLVEGLSSQLLSEIGQTLGRREQVLLFVNRRGFAPTLICHACGWVAQCGCCDANLVIHFGEDRLRCHHCGHEQALVRACAQCGDSELRPLGLGTERIEAALEERFPEARVARIDRDSTRRKGSLHQLLDDIHAGRVDILVGTQMLAKGHHFPKVTLVGIVDVDGGLHSTDYRAGERTAQLIMQVAGRAGREDRPGSVLLQTRQPGHPLLCSLIREDYAGFAEVCAAERAAAGLPPFGYQALWRAESAEADRPARFLAGLAEFAGRMQAPSLQVLGPVPAPLARRAGRHRAQLLLQSPRRGELHGAVEALLDAIPELLAGCRVQWSMDIDPVDVY
ncbi:primosomal protein N' [Methylomagnum ishizawai]|uniref:primosomal protein N' n=1 Tax=Methylomagnum ishizawai TaxID=1760988 RepID=UPI001C328C38|nr:primosomal protein N' [Methylomagnum ishizawai]BBL73082.1 primosomal protein N' [Methylomagnum ishizawai]